VHFRIFGAFLKFHIWWQHFPENQLPRFHCIGMAPSYQISDWYGGHPTCHAASGINDCLYFSCMCPRLCVRQLQPDFRSALFNIALLIANDLHRPLEAVPYLKQLLQVF